MFLDIWKGATYESPAPAAKFFKIVYRGGCWFQMEYPIYLLWWWNWRLWQWCFRSTCMRWWPMLMMVCSIMIPGIVVTMTTIWSIICMSPIWLCKEGWEKAFMDCLLCKYHYYPKIIYDSKFVKLYPRPRIPPCVMALSAWGSNWGPPGFYWPHRRTKMQSKFVHNL